MEVSMTFETKSVEINKEVVDSTTNETKTETTLSSLDDALKEIDKLKSINKEAFQTRDKFKAQLAKQEEDVLSNKKQAEENLLIEQKKFEELYKKEQSQRLEVENKFKNMLVDSSIKENLKDAVDVEVLMKLIDKSQLKMTENGVDGESLTKILDDLKLSKPFLFKQESVTEEKQVPKAPVPKRSTEVSNSSDKTYHQALRNAKSEKELHDVMRRYGRL